MSTLLSRISPAGCGQLAGAETFLSQSLPTSCPQESGANVMIGLRSSVSKTGPRRFLGEGRLNPAKNHDGHTSQDGGLPVPFGKHPASWQGMSTKRL